MGFISTATGSTKSEKNEHNFMYIVSPPFVRLTNSRMLCEHLTIFYSLLPVRPSSDDANLSTQRAFLRLIKTKARFLSESSLLFPLRDVSTVRLQCFHYAWTVFPSRHWKQCQC